ncbi:hypothetical protein Rsub_03521 [Raphidocelis subcapitata]|uniref:Phosphatidylinositol N-acetylglucosaminyltransferase subunit H conserved domain-containing protein n=1 Tax=Raphidocelis subcapitata TaxID=307507 RepID=A0A2V0P0B7_9CHLO|nr:hypothetical protein Rsub_03521 [Raphidocelis subcapitata]|eukprot:GBF90525.1 hypothetical protein Rsub_03521 [Raphidocelis subcapitata]
MPDAPCVPSHTFTVRLEGGFRGAAVGAAAASAAAALGGALAAGPGAAAAAAAAALALWALAYACQTVEESAEVLPGVGVALRSRRRHGGRAAALLDAERVRAVVVNEAVTAAGAHFYLAFALHGAGELAVAFPTLLPRLEVLQPMYAAIHDLLSGQQLETSGGRLAS